MTDDTAATPPLVGEVIEHGEIPTAPAAKPDKHWLFKPGDPRINRTGRSRGKKDRLAGDFLRDLAKWHAKHGYKAIERVGRENPVELLRIIASVVPKEAKVELEHTGGVAVGVVDIQEIKQRTRDLLARLGNPDDPGLREG